MRYYKGSGRHGVIHVFAATEYHGRNVLRMLCGHRDWTGVMRETVKSPDCARCLRRIDDEVETMLRQQRIREASRPLAEMLDDAS